MAMRSTLVAGNWKMHGGMTQNHALLTAILDGTRDLGSTGAAVCVPYPYLQQARAALQASHVSWGAQNVSQYDKGAYTGEVSAGMLMDFNCRYVVVGHSERRALYGEDNYTVALSLRPHMRPD